MPRANLGQLVGKADVCRSVVLSAGPRGAEGDPLFPVKLGSGSLLLWEGSAQPEWELCWTAWAFWGWDGTVGWVFLFFPEQ